MRSFQFLSLFLSLCLGDGQASGVTNQEEKLRLDGHFENISQNARNDRYRNGITGLAVGTALGVGAVILSNSSASGSTGPVVLGITGVILALGGGISLFSPTAFEEWPESYFALPSSTAEQMQLKIGRGEFLLGRLAEKARKQRYFSSGTLLVIGAGEMVWGFSNAKSDQSYLIYQGSVWMALGLLPLFFESEAESENRAFHDWKVSKKEVSFDLRFKPVPNGGTFVATVRF